MHLDDLKALAAVLDANPPSFRVNPARRDALLRVGEFLERAIRPGCPFDATKTDAVWHLIQPRLAHALAEARGADLGRREVVLWQMYNHGVIVNTGGVLIGFDIIPMPQAFGWEELPGWTDTIAGALDLLIVTHHHGDHYRKALVRSCLAMGKPVILPGPLVSEWGCDVNLHAAEDGWETEIDDLHILAREGFHLWRQSVGDVPLRYYEVTCQEGYRFIFGGDLDYTKKFEKTAGAKVDLFFVPWRNPNEIYEAGHPAQEATTIDAVKIAIERIAPRALLFEHCGELEHVQEGFPPSYDIALDLQARLPVPSDLLYWGEHVRLAGP